MKLKMHFPPNSFAMKWVQMRSGTIHMKVINDREKKVFKYRGSENIYILLVKWYRKSEKGKSGQWGNPKVRGSKRSTVQHRKA